jgi:hypothetical protein
MPSAFTLNWAAWARTQLLLDRRSGAVNLPGGSIAARRRSTSIAGRIAVIS